MKRNRTVVICAVIAVAGVVGVAGCYWLYRQSRPQQLAAACKNLAWEKLVAPSTAKFASFSVAEPGGKSIIAALLQTKITAARAELAKASATIAETTKAGTELSRAKERIDAQAKRGEISNTEYIESLKTYVSLSMEFTKIVTANLTAKIQAQKDLAKSIKDKDEYDAFHNGEVVILFDSQNRAGAMLRMEAVCTWRPQPNTKQTVATVSLVRLEEAGR